MTQPSSQESNYVIPIVVLGVLLVGAAGFFIYTFATPPQGDVVAKKNNPITVFRDRHRCGDGVDAVGGRLPRFGFSVKSVEECFHACETSPNMSSTSCNHVSFYSGMSHSMLYHGLNCIVNSSGCTANHESVGHADGKGLVWKVYQH